MQPATSSTESGVIYAITSLLHLIELYEDRGDDTEALKVAKIAAGFGQYEEARQRLLWKTGVRKTEPVPEADQNSAPAPKRVPASHPSMVRWPDQRLGIPVRRSGWAICR